MFKTTTVLSVLSGLLLAAVFARPVSAEAQIGGVELVSAAAADDVAPARLTITGLDRSYRVQVELPTEASPSPVRVELPAGLYAIDAAASIGTDELVIPALSAPKLVVVAAGHITTVNVRSEEARGAVAMDATF